MSVHFGTLSKWNSNDLAEQACVALGEIGKFLSSLLWILGLIRTSWFMINSVFVIFHNNNKLYDAWIILLPIRYYGALGGAATNALQTKGCPSAKERCKFESWLKWASFRDQDGGRGPISNEASQPSPWRPHPEPLDPPQNLKFGYGPPPFIQPPLFMGVVTCNNEREREMICWAARKRIF